VSLEQELRRLLADFEEEARRVPGSTEYDEGYNGALRNFAAGGLRKVIDRHFPGAPLADAMLPSGQPLSNTAKDLIRQAVRPEAAFGKPFTVYGSAGPYRPTNPEDAGDGA
jgi:hypothetical protein